MKTWVVVAWTFVLVLLAGTAAAGGKVEGVRIWPAPDHTRLVFDTASQVSHNVFSLSSPDRLVIDLKNVALAADFDQVNLSGSPIKRIRSAPRNGDDLRVCWTWNPKSNPAASCWIPTSNTAIVW